MQNSTFPSRKQTLTHHLKWQLAVSAAHYMNRANKAKESRAGFSLHDPVWSLKENLKTNEFWIHVSSVESKAFYLYLE